MKNNYSDSNLPVFLAISGFLHAIIICFIYFGFSFKIKNLQEEKVIAFELLPVGPVNNIKTQKIQKEATIKNEDAKLIEKNKVAEAPEEKPMEKKEEKPTEKTAELPKEAEKIQDKEKKLEEKKPEEKKEEAKKDEKKKIDEKKPKPKKKAPNDKELDSLLKNLEKESDGKNDKSKKVNREKSDATSDAFGNYDDTRDLSLTNDEIIKQQIMRKWNQPVASASEDIIITVELKLQMNGAVDKAVVVSARCPGGKDILCNATKDSIIRAITNASPLEHLLPDDYSSWQNITIHFNTNR